MIRISGELRGSSLYLHDSGCACSSHDKEDVAGSCQVRRCCGEADVVCGGMSKRDMDKSSNN
jgi:hypothetical protein